MNEARRTNPIKIKLDHIGGGTLEIGGRKLENYVTGLQVISKPGELTMLRLDVFSGEGLEMELDALVDVTVHHVNETFKETVEELAG